MRGRCFDIEKHKWKTVTPFSATNLHVHWMGFNGYTGRLQEAGWVFSVVENHFTKRKKLMMRNSALGMIASGDYGDGELVIMRHLSTQKIWGKSRIKIMDDLIDLENIEISDLFDAIVRRQKSEVPQKPKSELPVAQVISIIDRMKA